MALNDWLDDACRAIQNVANTPTFPGEVPLSRRFVDKLITRLYGECHNDGKVGEDDCPTCRAWKTEQVTAKLERSEALVGQHEQALKETREALAAVKVRAGELEDDLDASRVDIDTLVQENHNVKERAKSLAAQLEESAGAYKRATEERDRLRTVVNQTGEQLGAAQARLAAYEAALKGLREI